MTGHGEPKTRPRLDQETGQRWQADPAGASALHGNSLCLFCGKTGHIAKECPKLMAIAAQAHATIAELQESFIEEAKKN